MPPEIDEPIEIVDYDPRWSSWFAEDARELRLALGPNFALEHFGSTAVPALASKPIIDILVAPPSWPLGNSEREALERLGYEHLGEAGVPGREYLRRRASHATNLAVVTQGGSLWTDNLAVRNYLLAHPDAAQAYGAAKQAAWSRGARTLLGYSRAKQELILNLVAEARAWNRLQ